MPFRDTLRSAWNTSRAKYDVARQSKLGKTSAALIKYRKTTLTVAGLTFFAYRCALTLHVPSVEDEQSAQVPPAADHCKGTRCHPSQDNSPLEDTRRQYSRTTIERFHAIATAIEWRRWIIRRTASGHDYVRSHSSAQVCRLSHATQSLGRDATQVRGGRRTDRGHHRRLFLDQCPSSAGLCARSSHLMASTAF